MLMYFICKAVDMAPQPIRCLWSGDNKHLKKKKKKKKKKKCPFLKLRLHREYYTSTRWRRFILQRVVSKTYLTSESELDTFGNHEL